MSCLYSKRPSPKHQSMSCRVRQDLFFPTPTLRVIRKRRRLCTLHNPCRCRRPWRRGGWLQGSERPLHPVQLALARQLPVHYASPTKFRDMSCKPESPGKTPCRSRSKGLRQNLCFDARIKLVKAKQPGTQVHPTPGTALPTQVHAQHSHADRVDTVAEATRKTSPSPTACLLQGSDLCLSQSFWS